MKILNIITFSMLMLTASITHANPNRADCDQVIDKGFYKICYDYQVRGAKYVWYTLDGDKVNAVNIKKRPRFYAERKIPKKYRTKHSDYTHSGLDRGHLANDASFDVSIASQKSTYSMANIIPQYPKINRYTWIKAEKYERKVAVKLGKVKVINGVEYDNPRNKLKSGITIPSAYWKQITNKAAGFERCFYYKNDPRVKTKGDKLRDHVVDCESLR